MDSYLNDVTDPDELRRIAEKRRKQIVFYRRLALIYKNSPEVGLAMDDALKESGIVPEFAGAEDWDQLNDIVLEYWDMVYQAPKVLE